MASGSTSDRSKTGCLSPDGSKLYWLVRFEIIRRWPSANATFVAGLDTVQSNTDVTGEVSTVSHFRC